MYSNKYNMHSSANFNTTDTMGQHLISSPIKLLSGGYVYKKKERTHHKYSKNMRSKNTRHRRTKQPTSIISSIISSYRPGYSGGKTHTLKNRQKINANRTIGLSLSRGRSYSGGNIGFPNAYSTGGILNPLYSALATPVPIHSLNTCSK